MLDNKGIAGRNNVTSLQVNDNRKFSGSCPTGRDCGSRAAAAFAQRENFFRGYLVSQRVLTMIKRRQGLSNRAYAKHAGVSAPYVQKLVDRGKIPVLADGSLDPAACDLARSRNTNLYRGERRRLRQAALEGASAATLPVHRTCTGCGESFREIDARAGGSPDPRRFCSGQCCSDVAAGLTRAQIRRRVNREACA